MEPKTVIMCASAKKDIVDGQKVYLRSLTHCISRLYLNPLLSPSCERACHVLSHHSLSRKVNSTFKLRLRCIIDFTQLRIVGGMTISRKNANVSKRRPTFCNVHIRSTAFCTITNVYLSRSFISSLFSTPTHHNNLSISKQQKHFQ